MITSDRNEPLGAHVKPETKVKLRREANHQKASMSRVVSDILDEKLAELEARRQQEAQ